MSSPAKRENPLLNLLCNIVVPTVVLMNFSTEKWLGPLWGLIVALIFPVGYGIYDLIQRKKTNFLSILGFISVLCSGGLALAQVGGFWFAVKDALLPTIIGVAVLLYAYRNGDAQMRSVWLCTRNDAIGNVAVMLAAAGVFGMARTILASAPRWPAK